MKKRTFLKFAFGLFAMLAFFVAPVSAAITTATGLSLYATVPGSIYLHYKIEKLKFWQNHDTGIYMYAVQKEIWCADVVSTLFKNNQFLNYAVNHDDYVLAGKVVHVTNAAAPSSVTKNRNSFPATVTRRSDVDLTYALDEYTTDPRAIANADTVELAYDKRMSVTQEDRSALSETVGDNMLINWAPSAAITIRTSGAATAARMPGQTLNRNAFVEADLRKAMTKFNADNVPQEERYCLMDAYMYDDFINSLSATTSKDFSKYYDAEKGIVGKLHTFNIMMRSNVLVYNAAATTVNAYGAAVAATDNCAALCWSKFSVSRALGDVVMFDQLNAPQYYADVYSFLLRAGGRIIRNDVKGILAISQQ